MATLLEALSDGSFDMQNKRDLSSGFARELTSYRDKVVNDYVKHNMDLNKSIANLAKSKNFNDDQIQRVIEEVNNQVYLIEYSKLKEQPERNVTFDIAMLPKIKSIMDGSYKEPENNNGSNLQKTASECGSFEKIASDETQGDMRNLFNSYNVHSCSLRFETGEDESKIYLQKIAKNIVEEDARLEKMAKEMDNGLNSLGMAMIKYTQLGLDANSIFNQIGKEAGLSDRDMELVKIATETRLENLKQTTPMPEGFKVDLNIEKVANEDFSLGKFSMVKTASASNRYVPTIIVDKVSIKGMNELVKLASDVSGIVDEYVTRKQNYELMLDKVASLDLGNNAVDKLAKGFFEDTLSVANTEKVALDDSLALRNATKTLDGILAKNKRKLNINPIPKIEGVDSENKDNFTNMFNKATRKRKNNSSKFGQLNTQDKNYNSFNLQ